MNNTAYSVALVDDHALLRKGLVAVINQFSRFKVVIESVNGFEFIRALHGSEKPDLVLLDISMPVMDGYATAAFLKDHHPGMGVIAVSMHDDAAVRSKMFACGADAFIQKSAEPAELNAAMHAVMQRSYLNHARHRIHNKPEIDAAGSQLREKTVKLNNREKAFLELACTELTYKEIANRLYVSPRTVDSYRDNLFEKLNTKSRVGLAVYALKNGIARL